MIKKHHRISHDHETREDLDESRDTRGAGRTRNAAHPHGGSPRSSHGTAQPWLTADGRSRHRRAGRHTPRAHHVTTRARHATYKTARRLTVSHTTLARHGARATRQTAPRHVRASLISESCLAHSAPQSAPRPDRARPTTVRHGPLPLHNLVRIVHPLRRSPTFETFGGSLAGGMPQERAPPHLTSPSCRSHEITTSHLDEYSRRGPTDPPAAPRSP